MIKMRPVLDRTDLPAGIKEHFDTWVQSADMISSNGCYFNVDIKEYRDALEANELDELLDCYCRGNDYLVFMQWLEKQTSADEILVLYWW